MTHSPQFHGALVAASVFAATGAVAQDNAGPLEEVVITAERRTQSLQSLAIAATAVSGEALAKDQINSVDDLVKMAPALTVNDFGVGKSINIRGVGKNIEAPGVPAGVAYYVDGVAIPNSIFLTTPFYDLARVEVLRGPQGTLVGMNSTGGALLIVSNDPDPEAVDASAELSAGEFSSTRLRGMLNVPVGDRLAFRIAGEFEERDSFFDNVGPSSGEPGKIDRVSLRAAFGGDVTDNVSMFLRGEYNESSTDGFTGKVIPGDPGGPPNPVPYFVLQSVSPEDRFTLSRDVTSRDDVDYGRVSLNLNWSISDDLEFRSITGYQDGTRNLLNDGDGTVIPTTSVQIDIDETAFSQEFNLIGSTNDRFDWVLGAFYLDLETTGFVEPLLLAPGPFTGQPLVNVIGNSTTRNWGIFGQSTYSLTDATSLTLGLRYNDEEASNPGGIIQTFAPPGVPGPIFPESIENANDDAVTGRVTIDHQINDDHFGFVTISKGFKGGGTNSAPLPPFASETVYNYELGLKSEFLDGRLRSQFGLFYMDFEDIQRTIFNPTTPQLSGIGNFSEAEISGFEVQVQGQFGQFGFDSALAYTKSELGSTTLVDDRYDVLTPVDLTGNALNFNPEWTFSLGLNYQAQLGKNLLLLPRIRYSYTDDQWSNIFQVNPTDLIESYGLVDASITLENEAGTWYVELYGSNLLDEEWVASKSTFASTPGRVEFYGAPRQLGVRVGFSM